MPEADAVWRAARRLHRALAGRPITRCELRWPSLAVNDLTGRSTLEVVPRGKHILHRLDDGFTLHSHLRMDGSWRILEPTRWPASHEIRALIKVEDAVAAGRLLGMLDLLPTAEESRLVGHLGPDLLGPDWDIEVASANLRASATTIGAALIDQRNLAGVGTMWAAELLWIERLGPWTSASDVDPDQLSRLLTRLHTLVERSCRLPIPTSTASQRRGETTYVHARSGQPCRRCGEILRVAMIGQAPQERTMFYCATCQGGLGPTDDGRLATPLGSRRSTTSSYRPSRGTGPGRTSAPPSGRSRRRRD